MKAQAKGLAEIIHYAVKAEDYDRLMNVVLRAKDVVEYACPYPTGTPAARAFANLKKALRN